MNWRGIAGFVVVGGVLATFPSMRDMLGYPRFLLTFLYFTFFWISLATSWNILTGYSGYFSFGHGAFYGIGVYTIANIITKTELPFIAMLPFAGVTASLIGLLIGLVVFRLRKLRGELFALLTLAVEFVAASIARNFRAIDGGYGVSFSIRSGDYPEFLGNFSEMMYYLGLAVALITVFAAYWIYHSRFGRGLFAIRDDEAVAEGLGVPTFNYKMFAFGLSTFFAGMAGGLHAVQISYVTIEGVFRLGIPLFVILMSLLGGRQHWLGPTIGAIIIHTLNDAFSNTDFQLINDLIIGGLLIIVILFVPEGLYDRLRDRFFAALSLAILIGVPQVIFFDNRLTEQAAYIMLFVLVLLMIPTKYYEAGIGRIMPARKPAMASGGD